MRFIKEGIMKNNEISKNKCCTCAHFNVYYTRGDRNFIETQFGYCLRKHCQCTADESCDKYIFKQYHRINGLPVEYWVNEVLKEICTIRQILEYENDQNKKV